jgi:hypothetical protein
MTKKRQIIWIIPQNNISLQQIITSIDKINYYVHVQHYTK